MSWASFIETAPRCDHAVQVYDGVDDLVDSVVRYLAAGFAIGAPAVVIATDERWCRFSKELETGGWEPEDLERQRLLVYRDAEEFLGEFMDGAVPSPELFARTVGGLIEDIEAGFPGQTIRAFGEIVDLLWQRGDRSAAVAVEELWNQLAQTHSFALLCAYHLNIFDIDIQTADLQTSSARTRTLDLWLTPHGWQRQSIAR